jgi:hypothetical protein
MDAENVAAKYEVGRPGCIGWPSGGGNRLDRAAQANETALLIVSAHDAHGIYFFKQEQERPC